MELILTNALDFKRSIEAVSVLIDEAELVIASEGLTLKATDPSQISLVDFELSKKNFSKFEVPETTKLGLDLDYLSQVLSRAKKEDQLSLVLDKDKSNLKITFLGSSKRSFSIPLIDVSEQQLPNPKIEFDAEIVVQADVLKESLKDAALISSHVILEATLESMGIKAHSSKGTLNSETKKSESCVKKFNVKTQCRSIFPLDYLQDMLKAADSSTEVCISLKTNAPVKLSYSIGSATIAYFLAPRIETE
ncbi:MAG: proliferating cell nuclear antigen (pcna) [Candidatus Diapherotrites archaeon]|nr:proliferating cell nuclear antigen (pcna) [Candidatus Diapherotrites archaeon]